MSEFLNAQLDFILFLYGLAFILFGMVALAISRVLPRGSWSWLAAFGFIHGLGEWLDLTALVTGDGPAFAQFRLLVMAVSYLCLIESARREAIALGLPAPGPWIHLILVLVPAIAWWREGSLPASVLARYCLALPGALAASALFIRHARAVSGSRRAQAATAAVLMIGYACAAGLVVPNAAFWPASVINTESFAATTGLPIQLVRGALAAGLAACVWSIWGRMAGIHSGSERYATFLRRMFAWVLLSLGVTLIGGWVITQVLGDINRAEIEDEAEGNFKVLASRFEGDSSDARAMVNMLAEDPAILALVRRGSSADRDPSAALAAVARTTLGAATRASAAAAGFVLDAEGNLLAGTPDADQAAARFRNTAAFAPALAGKDAQVLSYDTALDETSIFVTAPLHGADGRVQAVTVLLRSLGTLQSDLEDFDRPWFLLDPEGVIVMTNRPEFKFHALWPIASRKLDRLREQYPALDSRPLLERTLVDGAWVKFEGAKTLFRRSEGQRSWSIVLAMPPTHRFASRVLGIAITLLATLVALTYLLGRERQVHDNIEMERLMELQLVAQDLRSKAHTDALTGLFNRLRFDHAMVEEIARAERYRTPLSMIIFDIDHFKRVNDTHGHQAGDQVLVRLSRLAAGSVRNLDVLARWGGEEFVLLTPGCDIRAAQHAAEKLRQKIATTPFETVGQVTSSFGVAQFEPGDSAQSLIARADEALYQAKGAGRNRVMIALPRRAAE
jgi:diguanylate cyclase (GGDEF)-like protein